MDKKDDVYIIFVGVLCMCKDNAHGKLKIYTLENIINMFIFIIQFYFLFFDNISICHNFLIPSIISYQLKKSRVHTRALSVELNSNNQTQTS